MVRRACMFVLVLHFDLFIWADQERSRRRLAALSMPSLLTRCRTTMVGYVADEALRGNLPFPRSDHCSFRAHDECVDVPLIGYRAREDELLYVLRKLLELRLWPGTLWAALSENPSQHCVSQPSWFFFVVHLSNVVLTVV